MPYKSEKQRRFMYSQHPDIAARWDREGKNFIQGGSDLKPAKERRKARRGNRRKSRR